MSDKENLTPLKTLVFSMGFVLMGGMVALVGLAWKKIAAENHGMAGECPGGHVDLRGRGTVVDSVMQGHIMRVTLQKRDGQSEIVSIDVCSGTLLGALELQTDPSGIQE